MRETKGSVGFESERSVELDLAFDCKVVQRRELVEDGREIA